MFFKSPLFLLFFVALTTSSGVASAALYMRLPLDLILVFTTACISFAVYGINRYTDIEDAINDMSKSQFFRKHKYIFLTSFFILICSVALLLLTKKFTACHLCVIITGILYSFRVIPIYTKGAFVFKRLKDIPFAKGIFVALTWGISYFVINWLVYPSLFHWDFRVVLLIVCFVLACFVNTNFCDILDVRGDFIHNVPTIPVLFGTKNTYIYAILMPSFLFLLLIVYSLFVNWITIAVGIFLLVNLLYPLFYISINAFKRLPRPIIVPITDLSCVIYPAGLFILRFSGN